MSGLRRSWPVLRWLLTLAFAGLAAWVLNGHRSELEGFGNVLTHLRWWWLVPAVGLEAVSLLCFAGVQHRLLKAGGVRAPVGPLVKVTLASQAINNSVPGGPALAAFYGFRWYRRFGADDTVAGWALVGTAIAASLALALVAALGVVLATELGATLDLIPVVVGVLVVTVAVGALFVYQRPLALVANWTLRTSHRLFGRPRGDLETHIEQVVARITAVRLDWPTIARVVGWALGNWLADCGCFALSFLVIGGDVPWKGLLLAYGAGQLAANLPITPGGLGAVEGSITIALTYFGGAQLASIDAVFIYRLISFWLELVVGWGCFGLMALAVRRNRWPRTIFAPRPAAGPRPALAPASGPPQGTPTTVGGR